MKQKKITCQLASKFFTIVLLLIGLGIGLVLINVLVHLFAWVGWINAIPTFIAGEFLATFGTLGFSISDLISEIGGQHLIPIYVGTIELILMGGIFSIVYQLRKIFNNVEQKKLFFSVENGKSFEKIMKLTVGFGFTYILVHLVFGLVLLIYLLDVTLNTQGEFWITVNFSELFTLVLLVALLQGFCVLFKRGLELQEEYNGFV